MGGKMRGEGNVIQFPGNHAASGRDRPDLKRLKAPPEGIATIMPVPPKTVSVHAAMRELGKMLGDIDPLVYTRLGFHRKLKFSSYPDGIEFYDMRSKRAEPRAPEETLAQVELWVRLWYFSVFDAGDGILVGRYIDREHPDVLDGKRLGSLEHPIIDPKTALGDGIEAFIERLRSH